MSWDFHKQFINGQWVQSTGSGRINVVNPATMQPFEWVPDGTLIQASLTYDSETVFVLSRHAFDQGDDYTDEDSRVNEGTHYVQGEVQLPDVRFTANGQWVKPEVQSNASRTEYDAALQTTFLYWDRQVAGDAFTMDVGFTYADPNYRPET